MNKPNSTQYVLKKLNGGKWIEVDKQIVRWRKSRKKLMTRVEKPRIRALKAAQIKKEAATRAKAYKMFD